MKQPANLFVGDGRPPQRWRLAAVVTALAAVAIALTPAGSASPPSSGIKQYNVCLARSATPATCDTSTLPGGSTVSLTLTITNANSSTQSLGSMNLDGPLDTSGKPIFPINLDPAKGALPTFLSGSGAFGTNTSGELQLQDLNLAPGSQLSVSFSVTTPCAGSGTWKAPAKQSNRFLGTGNDFTLLSSNGLTSSSGGNCKLVWLYPPNNANKDAVITNTAYTPTVAGDVHYVTVEAVGSDGVTPIDVNSGTASLSKTGGAFDCGPSCGSFSGLTSATFQHGVATFPNLKSAFTGSGFTLQASATGFQPTPNSDPPFNISIDGKPCDPGASCSLSNELLGGTNDSRVDVSASSGLTFLGVNPYSYDPTSQRCGPNFLHVSGVTGFEEFHGGAPNGLTVTYYVNQKKIDATYGKNVGAQYIPICAGTFRVVNGVITPCTNPNDTTDTTGWPADEIDSNGRFTGTVGHAICRSDGRYWGIVPSFQDKTNPADGPQTLVWGSKIIDGTTYRSFTMAVPSQWDYKGGC